MKNLNQYWKFAKHGFTTDDSVSADITGYSCMAFVIQEVRLDDHNGPFWS